MLWGNSTSTGTDLQLNGNVVGIARNNVIGRRNASPASLVESQTLTTNPQFVNAINGDYRIKATSPLRNSGKDEIATGITDQDVEGNRRLQGTHVDRGAHEFAEILSDGFEN